MIHGGFTHEMGWEKAVPLLVLSQVVHVLVIWFAAWIINRDMGTLLNAVKFYFFSIALVIAGLIVIVAGTFTIFRDSSGLQALWILACMGGMIAVYFTILMKVFDVGFLGALVIVIIILPLNGFVSYVTSNAFGIKPGRVAPKSTHATGWNRVGNIDAFQAATWTKYA